MKNYINERRSVSLLRFLKSVLAMFLIVFVLYGCDEDDDIKPARFLVWEPSTIPLPVIPFFSAGGFGKGDDGKLYAYGNAYDYSESKNTVPVLVLSADNAWHLAANPKTSFSASSLQVVDNKTYFSSYTGLYQAVTDSAQLIYSFDTVVNTNIKYEYINDMESFDGKLLMHGRIKVGQTSASVLSYDGTSFSVLSENLMQAAFLRDHHDLFIELGNSLYQYNGSSLTLVKEDVSVIKIHNGQFYSLNSVNGLQQIVREDASGNIVKLGDPFPFHINIYQMIFSGDMPVVIGTDYDSQLSVTYFYENDKWTPIPTIVQLSSVVEFKGRILATSHSTQKIIELVSNN